MACTRNHLLSAFCSTLALSDRLCIRKRVNFPTVVGSQEWSVIFVRWKESDCRELSALINNLLMRSANDMSNAYSLYSSQRKLWFAEIPWLVYVSFPRWKTDAAGTTQIAKLNGTTHPSYMQEEQQKAIEDGRDSLQERHEERMTMVVRICGRKETLYEQVLRRDLLS